jgi:hypothetical protein
MAYKSQTAVVLEKVDRKIVQKFADKKGLGKRGFSAALRMIIREWDDYDRANSKPSTDRSMER